MVSLEEGLTESRTDEMNKWGRTQIYPRMRTLLGEQRGIVLDLVNHGLAMVDDELDSDSPKQLGHYQQMFRQSYSGITIQASTPAEQAVTNLGYALRRLVSAPFLHFRDRAIGKHTYQEVLNFWDIEERNFQRKGQILDRATLEEINLGIGALVASQFLYIFDSPRVYNEFTQLARAYGLAVKLADNLCDYREDIQDGFVNIPKEEIYQVRGISIENDRIIGVDSAKLGLSPEYVEREHERIKQVFDSADRLMLVARARRPVWSRKTDEALNLFGEFCHTWLEQANDFVEKQAKH